MFSQYWKRGQRQISRWVNTPPDWINTTLAMFRPLPWPSLTQVSRATLPRIGFSILKCALMLFNCCVNTS